MKPWQSHSMTLGCLQMKTQIFAILAVNVTELWQESCSWGWKQLQEFCIWIEYCQRKLGSCKRVKFTNSSGGVVATAAVKRGHRNPWDINIAVLATERGWNLHFHPIIPIFASESILNPEFTLLA